MTHLDTSMMVLNNVGKYIIGVSNISFQGLGNEGRLGTKCFSTLCRGVAWKRGFDWIVPGQNADRLDNYACLIVLK